MYTTTTSPPVPPSPMGDSILPDGIDFKELLERLRLEQQVGTGKGVVRVDTNQSNSLGRVVFGQSHWAREIVNHPA